MPNNARADKGELRLTATGNISLLNRLPLKEKGQISCMEVESLLHMVLRDWLELGVNLNHQFSKNASIDGAAISGIGGDERHELFATLRVFDASVALRTYLEFGSSLRLRPLLGLSLGIQATQYADAELFFENGAVVATRESEWDASLLTAAEVGVAKRINDSLVTALLVNIAVSDTATIYGLRLEFSWFRL